MTRVAIVGPESIPNMHLAETSRKVMGQVNTFRYLDTEGMINFAAKQIEPNIIFIDLMGFDLTEAINAIGKIRKEYPITVFFLYIDRNEYLSRENELTPYWQNRLAHFFKFYKPHGDEELEPIFRQNIRAAEFESQTNLEYAKTIMQRRNEDFEKGVLVPHHQKNQDSSSPDKTIFVSYSRGDWTSFVSDMIYRLQSVNFQIWVDQYLIIGGDDWMNALGEALDRCKILILVMTPESLASRYVKMEYRYFFHQEKPIIPILLKPLEKLPFELISYQHVNFTNTDRDAAYQKLIQSLQAYLAD